MEGKEIWPHLEGLNERFEFVAKELYFGQKNILDFNCGLGEFVNFIDGFNNYYGNDVNPEFISRTSDKGTFFVLEDDMLMDFLERKSLHTVLWFGYSVGESEGESKTALDSFLKIIDEKDPGDIVIEGVQEYFDKLGHQEMLEDVLEHHELVKTKDIVTGEIPALKRRVLIFERIL
jgi:hypothetical protein